MCGRESVGSENATTQDLTDSHRTELNTCPPPSGQDGLKDTQVHLKHVHICNQSLDDIVNGAYD